MKYILLILLVLILHKMFKKNNIEKLTEENEKITCNGTVYYGRRDDANGDAITDVNVLKVDGEYKEQTTTGEITCSSTTFGGDPLPDVYKQCICVPSGSTEPSNFSANSSLTQTIFPVNTGGPGMLSKQEDWETIMENVNTNTNYGTENLDFLTNDSEM